MTRKQSEAIIVQLIIHLPDAQSVSGSIHFGSHITPKSEATVDKLTSKLKAKADQVESVGGCSGEIVPLSTITNSL